MIALNAMNLERFPVTGLSHVRDLIHFDGPLLSQYRHANGEHYLYYWCDCDKAENRWMVLRVAEATILRLVNQLVPLAEVIPSASRDDFVYFLDIHQDQSVRAYLSLTTAVPEEYRPEAGKYLEFQDAGEGDHSYSFLLQGDWSIDAIGDFPKTFNKVYSLIYGMNVLHAEGYATHPWRGGFSSLHFFNEAMSEVPRRDRPSLDAIHKSSPGFVRFSLDTRTALEVVRCILDFKSKEWTISDDARTLRQFIRRHGLNDLDSPDSDEWESVNRRLETLAGRLLSEFTVIDENQFMKMCPRPFEAAKIALTFVKYIRDLINYERQGLIEFPKRLSPVES